MIEKNQKYNIAVIGLGYVGLPLAVALAEKYQTVIGFDINQNRVHELNGGHDSTHEVEDDLLQRSTLRITAHDQDLNNSNIFIVTVPTPIDDDKQPDLSLLESASLLIAPYITKGAIIVFESTVYPGVTEDYCGKILEKATGLVSGQDFKLGYSPERINPGDKVHRLETITKIVSGQDTESLNIITEIYGSIIEAGLHQASSIKVAEAAKVIENTQRDINIALMNELAKIFALLDINTHEVLKAAGTKWNFLPFTPGLVGGHCIGVDPYYLTNCAERLGYAPELILAGRHLNDSMGQYVAQSLIKLLIKQKIRLDTAKIAVLGMTFKEDVPDFRNSRSPDIVAELRDYGLDVVTHDPYDASSVDMASICDMDMIIIAVGHKEYKALTPKDFQKMLKEKAIIGDIKSLYQASEYHSDDIILWQL
jgi:UDP-N-acetyl-D-galactosamine dehydrogenase